jgi:proline dehydrogenase
VSALTFLARRFVAGESADAAVAAGRKLKARGISATFDLLGEDVHDERTARAIAEANRALLQQIPAEVERNVSVKLTNLGLDVSRELCLELTASVLEAAKQAGGFVRIDMEGSKHTQQTLDVFRELRSRYDNVGIVLQAALHRTKEDVQEAVRRKDRVRLCKGAYKEPASIAWTRMDDVRKGFREYAELLLEKGERPAIATHDEGLIQHTLAFTRERGVAAARFEFQMLYGLRPARWEELVKSGHNVRIYVPYGTHWFPYFYRRLRERKENVLFVLRSLLGG